MKRLLNSASLLFNVRNKGGQLKENSISFQVSFSVCPNMPTFLLTDFEQVTMLAVYM